MLFDVHAYQKDSEMRYTILNLLRHSIGCLSLLLVITDAEALPFNECPSEAFLIQDNTARIYGVNLATGFYSELSDNMGTSGKINAAGFNVHDNYIYAWSYEFNNVVRIGNDYQIENLSINSLPSTQFYVGDVALHENAYYFYRRGSDFGLYKISLDESHSNYHVVDNIANGSELDVRIFDFAFHPTNQFIYSVDNTGNLIRIDPVSGTALVVSNVGQSGTFGAVYFDSNENFYISRNSDGFIFRVNLNIASPTAEFFAFGPSSSNNDGARCALADIISEDTTVDFGDAPASYGNNIENNGARHEISEGLYLGDSVGGSDDGVDFVTGFESGLDTLIRIDSVGSGILNAWVDWDQNGEFEESESTVTNLAISEGSQNILIDVPEDAADGSTWARFRYSTQSNIGPNGGVSDGEVEDHQIVVSRSGVAIESYPSTNDFVTLAYEDNWPQLGDYDMNDVVIAYRTRRYIDDNNRIVRFDVEGRLLALGASYHNGFAVQLDGVKTENINQQLIRHEVNGLSVNALPLEDNAANEDAVFIVSSDLWLSIQADDGCNYYRTEILCEREQDFYFSLSMPLIESIPIDGAPSTTFNPFIFASPGHYHGDVFTSHPGRGLEIHLKNKKVSPAFNFAYFGMSDDESSEEEGLTFLSANNMPWAIELPTLWSHPLERIDIINAYPGFSEFVQSDGLQQPTWYEFSNAQESLIMENN